jgi:hypothetical protein
VAWLVVRDGSVTTPRIPATIGGQQREPSPILGYYALAGAEPRVRASLLGGSAMLSLVKFLGWHTGAEIISAKELAGQDGQGIGSLAAQVIAGLAVAFIAGVVGALYQIRRTRARPFLVPEGFTRELFDAQDIIRLPQDAVDLLSRSVYLASFGVESLQLGIVEECVRSCGELQERGRQLLTALEEVLRSIRNEDDDDKLKIALRSSMDMNFFDKFLLAAAKGRRLADEETLRDQISKTDQLDAEFSQSKRTVAPVPFFAPDNTVYQFGFPGKPVRLVEGINNWPTAGQQLRPFCQTVRFLNRPLLEDIFDQLAILLRGDLEIAKEVLPELVALLRDHSRCISRMYVANYGSEPMLIRAEAELYVKGGVKKSSLVVINCALAAITQDGGLTRLENGYLLSAGADARIGFVGPEQQTDTATKELEHLLVQGACLTRVKFACLSSTWPTRKTVRSKWVRSTFNGPGSHGDGSGRHDGPRLS